MENKKKQGSIIKDAIALFLITLIAGGLLGLVNQITLEPIANAKEKAKKEAYQAVMKDAASFEADEYITKKVEQSATAVEGTEITEVLIAKDSSGNTIGYVMSITDHEGYGGDITMSLGFDENINITGFEILSASSETPGLGATCTDETFRNQFLGKGSEEIAYVKGKPATKADNEIDALSGATITTKGIVKTVNAGISFLKGIVVTEFPE